MRFEEAQQELFEIYRMPHGTPRIERAEQIARRIELEGPEEKLAEALLDLVEAYVFGDEGHKGFSGLARTLRWFDERPELFDDADRRNLFWEFKWVAGDLADWAQIERSGAENVLADMERRYALAGYGASGPLAAKFRYAYSTGDIAGAEQLRGAWLAAPRDEMSQCEACEPGELAEYYTEQERYGEALDLAPRMHGNCNIEPSRGLSALALSQLLSGNLADAEQSVRTSQRRLQIDTPTDLVVVRARLLEVLLRAGEHEEALKMLRTRDLVLLESCASPLDWLRVLLSLLAGFSAAAHVAPETPTGLAPGLPQTIAEARDWAAAESMPLVAQFDARNGNAYFSQLRERASAATPSNETFAEVRETNTTLAPTSTVTSSVPEEHPMSNTNLDFTTLAPLSKERMQAVLDAMDINHGTDDDGDIVAAFDDHMFWFFTGGESGEIFLARAHWRAWLPNARLQEALETVNEWNGSRFFPAVSLIVDNDGDVILRAMRAADCEFGITDAQLSQELRTIIGTALQFFELLEERFPTAVADAEAQREERRRAQG